MYSTLLRFILEKVRYTKCYEKEQSYVHKFKIMHSIINTIPKYKCEKNVWQLNAKRFFLLQGGNIKKSIKQNPRIKLVHMDTLFSEHLGQSTVLR